MWKSSTICPNCDSYFEPDDFRSFGHRSRMSQKGYAPEEYRGRPVIAIINTWSDLNQCHAHFRQRAEDVKRGFGGPLPAPV